jgi:predicted nucleotidyltransferase
MTTIHLPQDFKEFLKLLTLNNVFYLVIGGYAVGFHGYPRATGDLDIWVRRDRDNARNLLKTLTEFGFNVPVLTLDVLLTKGKIIRMGVPPVRIEVLNDISGVEFNDCFKNSIRTNMDGMQINFIGLEDLKTNKKAAGRLKYLADVENLGG